LPIVEFKSSEETGLGCVKIQIEFNDSIVANWQIEEEKAFNRADELEKTTVLVDSARLTRSLGTDPGRKPVLRSY
jgi:hypothetical protein